MITFRELLRVEQARPSAFVTPGLSTGLDDLDELTMGLRPGAVWLVTGASQVGRSSWATQLAGSAALDTPDWVSLVSCRDDERLVVARLIASKGPIPIHHLLSRRLNAEDDARYRRAADVLSGSGLRVHFPHGCAATRSIERFADRSKARLLVIDDLQLWAGDQLTASLELLSAWSVRASGTVIVTVPDHLVPVGGAELADWTQAIDIAIRLVRPEQHPWPADDVGEVGLDVLWHRLSPTARLTAVFQGYYARIVSP